MIGKRAKSTDNARVRVAGAERQATRVGCGRGRQPGAFNKTDPLAMDDAVRLKRLQAAPTARAKGWLG